MNHQPKQFDHSESVSVNEQFLTLFVANQKRIFAYILTLVPNRADAEDIMQQTITAMWRMFDRFEAGTNFLAWGMQIARFRVLKFRQQQKKAAIRFEDAVFEKLADLPVDQHSTQQDKIDAVQGCLKKLSANDKELIQMRYDQSIAIKEIAIRLNRSVQGMYKVMARIHTQLQECIAKKLVVEER